MMFMGEESLRLRKLLEHWIEHNDDHVARFWEAAEEAGKFGLKETSSSIRLAAEKGNEVSKHLRKAINSM